MLLIQLSVRVSWESTLGTGDGDVPAMPMFTEKHTGMKGAGEQSRGATGEQVRAGVPALEVWGYQVQIDIVVMIL